MKQATMSYAQLLEAYQALQARVSALEGNEERFRMLADNISQLAWTCDLLGNVTWYNKRWLDYTGLTFEDMQGWGWTKVQHPEHVDRVVARVQRAGETGEPWEDTFPLRGRDGQYRWFLSRALPIRDAQGTLVQWFGTNTDITEQKLAEEQVARQAQELRALNARLQELDRLKTAFFANVSHEFRTPLTLMLGPVEDILAKPEGQVVPANRELLTIVQRNGLRLQRLVNTLLDFSRLEAGRAEASYEPTDLATLTADLASTFRSACERAGLRLVVDCPVLSAPVCVDRDMWEKIVLNLLSNAFKFTFTGEITVSLRPAGEAVELAVRDTGIGIPAVEIPHLFERFHRVAGVHGRTHEGTGIGLALLQDLVQLHGGSVRVESAPGRGSTFVVSIPTGTAHLPADRIGGTRTLASTALGAASYVEEALRWLPEAVSPVQMPPGQAPGLDDLVRPPSAAVLPPLLETNAAGSRARILWADDTADMRDYVRRLLSARYDVEAVADGQAALEAARACRPDLILADLMMPRLDGFGMLRALRADPDLRTLPIILLSARAGEESRIEGLEAGADAYLIKPFSARELLAHVEAHLELGRLRARVAQVVRESQNHITRLNAQLRADLASMTRLQQVSTRLVQTGDFSSLLDEILDAAIAITGADMGNIQLLDGDTLKIVAHRGFDAPFLAFFNAVHDGLAACGPAMQRGERVIVEDVATSPLFVGSPAYDVMLAAQARAVQFTPLLTRSGRLLGMFSTHYRTPHRPAQRELRLLDLLVRQAADCIERAQTEAVREQLAAIVDASDDAIIGKTLEGVITSWNHGAERLYGYTAAEVIGQPIWLLVPPDMPDELPQILARLQRGEHIDHYETQRVRKDGTRLDVALTISPIRDSTGRVIGASKIARDITARKQAEAMLQQAYAALEQRVQERTALLTLIQNITRAANEAPTSAAALQYAVDCLCAYTGWPIGHVYLAVVPGADRWAPTAFWHLDASERFAAFQQATQTLEMAAGEGLIGRVSVCGQPEWLRDVATDPTFERRQAAQAAGLTTGVACPILAGSEVAGVLEFYTTEALAPNPDLLEAMTQIGIQLGRVIERERAADQLQRQQEALLQREKLAAMSTMLASVAHELNNPLASIVLQAELLHEDLRDGPLAEPVTEITQAAARCERLVRQFLTLTRQHLPERAQVALNTLVAEAVELLAYPFRVDNVVLHLQLDEQLPPLWGDPHQLQQVLINLLANAQQALRAAPGTREVTLTTQYHPAQHRITLAMADSGPGIPAALQGRIFEPFFTTKPPGVGTGLGLPLCRGIVEAHGGTLEVTSTLGAGATFRVTLPVEAVPAPQPAPPGVDAEPVGRGHTILVVDDERSLATGLARLLRRDGHTVDIAANGRLALAKLDERTYDLILCDVRMPELDGPSLYRLLARQQPHLCQCLIFLTGDTLEPATQAFLEQSGAPCLTKPFTGAEARRVIRRVLHLGHPAAPASASPAAHAVDAGGTTVRGGAGAVAPNPAAGVLQGHPYAGDSMPN